MTKRIAVGLLVAVARGAAGGLEFDAGVDARFRYDWKGRPLRYQNNRASATATDPHDPRYQDYYRMRTRFWGEVSYGDVTVYSRLANEFRGYHNANNANYRGLFMMARYDFPLLRPTAERRGGVRGTLLAEVIDAGDYYADAGTAYCLRFELNANF